MNEAQASVSKNLAWFKLSEFILRGEKERAFGIYKILVLAFDSEAFCALLEGDLYASFNEHKMAFEKYLHAAKLYESAKETFLAAITYESLIKVADKSANIWQQLLILYQEINYMPKIEFILKNLFYNLLKENRADEAKEILNELEKIGNSIEERELWSIYLLEINAKDEALMHINKILEDHFVNGSSMEIQKFLSKLYALDQDVYNYAINQMKDKN